MATIARLKKSPTWCWPVAPKPSCWAIKAAAFSKRGQTVWDDDKPRPYRYRLHDRHDPSANTTLKRSGTISSMLSHSAPSTNWKTKSPTSKVITNTFYRLDENAKTSKSAAHGDRNAALHGGERLSRTHPRDARQHLVIAYTNTERDIITEHIRDGLSRKRSCKKTSPPLACAQQETAKKSYRPCPLSKRPHP